MTQASPPEHSATPSEEAPLSRVQIPAAILYGVFFLSGMAALIYQLIWQRALFTIYGTNTESVTIVVAAFMLGLGIGSLVGGELSKRMKGYLLLVFAVLEVLIGVYGVLSLAIFEWMGTMTLGASVGTAGTVSFLTVLFPTSLMGATLPMLVAHLVAATGNVGRSVGRLYFVNTLGSAAACFWGALSLFHSSGMQGAVYTAAAINGIVAAIIFIAYAIQRSGPEDAAALSSETDA